MKIISKTIINSEQKVNDNVLELYRIFDGKNTNQNSIKKELKTIKLEKQKLINTSKKVDEKINILKKENSIIKKNNSELKIKLSEYFDKL